MRGTLFGIVGTLVIVGVILIFGGVGLMTCKGCIAPTSVEDAEKTLERHMKKLRIDAGYSCDGPRTLDGARECQINFGDSTETYLCNSETCSKYEPAYRDWD